VQNRTRAKKDFIINDSSRDDNLFEIRRP
jgi:hypothetical protein